MIIYLVSLPTFQGDCKILKGRMTAVCFYNPPTNKCWLTVYPNHLLMSAAGLFSL